MSGRTAIRQFIESDKNEAWHQFIRPAVDVGVNILDSSAEYEKQLLPILYGEQEDKLISDFWYPFNGGLTFNYLCLHSDSMLGVQYADGSDMAQHIP
ncbi:hypothetical protein ABW21_db0202947 [Orbilia brochopaga]|nr:hypothetical protein ABW21_db0202947 [Drechslerella brochopaga]